MRLQDWENRFRPYLSQIELLGEIPLSQMEHAELERALRAFVQQHGLTEATRRLKADYPAAFVTYLAFKAAFNDERAFWDKVAQNAGLESQQPLFHPAHHWGQTFLEIVESHPNLRQFRRVSGLEYITPIRLHGGIPAFSLPDFFQYILLPSVNKAPYDGMEDKAALNALLAHYTAQLFVDDVVRHFFRYAGEAADKFFSKCRHMARLAQAGQPLPAPETLGLRPYVVQAFQNFQVSQSAPAQRRRRPRLEFDPYAPGFRIVLPPQPLSLEQAGQRYDARICNPVTGEVYAEQMRLRPRRQGQDWFLEEIEWTLAEPLEIVQAGIFAQGDDQPLFSYLVHILPSAGYPPLLAFRYEDCRHVPLAPSLPARDLWLFYPANCEMRCEGAAHSIEILHPFPPPWNSWQAAAWDLSKARLLRLLRDGQDICPPILVSRPLEPTLLPPTLPRHVMAVEEKPLYNAAPVLCLPLQNPQNPTEELKDWHVRLESRYAARPQGEWQAKGTELPFQTGEGEARLPLSHWLGEAPAGTYHLTLTHRNRPVSELPFRVCAGLEIGGLKPYYLPTKDGAREVDFTITLPEAADLQAEDDTRVSSAPQGKHFTLSIPPEASLADLRIHLPAALESIQIPLRIALPRLRWALIQQKGAALEWSHQPITRPLAELLQADLALFQPRLRVELPLRGGEKPLAALHLVLPEQNKPLQTSESHALSGQWLEFSLAAFFDTIRAYPGESIFELIFELMDSSLNLNVFIPVMHLSRELNIQEIQFELLSAGLWRIHWYEPRPLRHRRLRLWSRWQPWADPIEIHLPDDAAPSTIKTEPGWWQFDIRSEEASLPPSRYCAHFVAVAPYEHNPPPRFPPEQAIEILVTQPQARLAQIEVDLTGATPVRAFAFHFEKLCIYHTLNHADAIRQEIQWCLAHWRDASLLHLESLARWLGEYDNAQDQQAFLMYMFRQEKLQQLEEERYSRPFVEKYLANITHARTVKPESVRRILSLTREPIVILHALKLLLKSNAEEARHTFREALAQGRFSESDAATLLKENVGFAEHLLQNFPASPIRTRLLRELARHLDLPEYLVRVGYHVLSDVGWGKIVEIRGAQREDYFFNGEEQPELMVELLHWAGQKAEIDIKNQQITLPGRTGVNRCACGRFAALGGATTRPLWQEHKKFCSQNAVSPLPASFTMVSTLIYRAHQPPNPLDTRIGD